MAGGAKVVAGCERLRAAASIGGGVLKGAFVDVEGGQVVAIRLDDDLRLDVLVLDLIDGEWVVRCIAVNQTLCSVEAVQSAPVEVQPAAVAEVLCLPVKRLPAKCLPAPVVDAASGDGWAA